MPGAERKYIAGNPNTPWPGQLQTKKAAQSGAGGQRARSGFFVFEGWTSHHVFGLPPCIYVPHHACGYPPCAWVFPELHGFDWMWTH